MAADSEQLLTVSQWLDQQVEDGKDVSQLQIPSTVLYDSTADETVFFEEIKPCSILCDENHPHSTVKRFGRWFVARGQDRKAGIHSDTMKWQLNTRDKAKALHAAKAHLAE